MRSVSCLYGSENWLLTDPLLHILEAFQAEIRKRILCLPKLHSNLCPLVALKWPSMRYHILIQKLGFLCRLANSQQPTTSVKISNSMKYYAPGPLIFQQLKQAYNMNVTASIMDGDGSSPSLNSLNKALKAADSDYLWSLVGIQNSLRALSRSMPWPKLWDMAHNQGIQGA